MKIFPPDYFFCHNNVKERECRESEIFWKRKIWKYRHKCWSLSCLVKFRGCNFGRDLGLTVRSFTFFFPFSLPPTSSSKRSSLCVPVWNHSRLPLLTNIPPVHLLPSALGYTSIVDDQWKQRLVYRIFHNSSMQNFETSLFWSLTPFIYLS